MNDLLSALAQGVLTGHWPPLQNYDRNSAALLQYTIRNWHLVKDVWQRLGDRESQDLFRDLLLQRILGWQAVTLSNGVTSLTQQRDLAPALQYADPAEQGKNPGDPRQAVTFRHVPAAGMLVDLISSPAHMRDVWRNNQYFFKRNGVAIRPEPGDVVLDCGAFWGDTAVLFAAACTCAGAQGRVLSFEPLPENQAYIEANRRRSGFEDIIEVLPYAVGDATNNVHPRDVTLKSAGEPDAFRVAGHENQIAQTSIDDVVAARNLTRVDLIKMDVENYEKKALKGAVQTITNHRPKLAISAYHDRADLVNLPGLILNYWPDYEIYFEHYRHTELETVLYARPNAPAAGP